MNKFLLYPLFLPVVAMPGRSYRGARPALSSSQIELRKRLTARVHHLAVVIGERSIARYSGILDAMAYIPRAFAASGYAVEEQKFVFDNMPMPNYIVEKVGLSEPEKIIVIGAHYDTVSCSPGADDNATGVAAVLELARIFAEIESKRTIRFVAFANEEVSSQLADTMGSYEYAKQCRERNEEIVGMFSLEMLGCFTNHENSQKYPSPLNLFYPTTGNFVAFVGNSHSRRLVRAATGAFRRSAKFPSEGAAAPDSFRDAGRSDHSSFWKFGYPALMVTDTSNFRYEHYHAASDTPDKLDFDAYTLVVDGLVSVIIQLAG